MTAIETLLLGAIGTLSSCVVWLFFELRKAAQKCEEDKHQCDEDRRKLWEHVYRLESFAKLPGRADPKTLSAIRPDVKGKPDTDQGFNALPSPA